MLTYGALNGTITGRFCEFADFCVHKSHEIVCNINDIYKSYEGGAEMRVKVTMACQECKQRNYNTMKNKKNNAERIELNKYCPFCNKHTLHKETK